MKKTKHILYCPFTGLGLHQGFRGNSWLKNRIKVFKEFVLPSILNQYLKGCLLWVSWRPEEENNVLVQEFYQSLSGIQGLELIFTYKGLCFWDDKYDDKEALKRLTNSLNLSLPQLKEYVEGCDYIYLTIQPSDDMYLFDVLSLIHQEQYEYKKVVGFTKGYIMNYSTKEIAEYNPNTLPPFFTIIFPITQFLDTQEHLNYTGPYKSHEYIKDTMNFKELEGRKFVVGTHGENISTTFNHPYKGYTLDPEDRDRILLLTGTFWSDYVIIKKGRHLIMRNILNYLPFQHKLRKFYHSLPIKWQIF